MNFISFFRTICFYTMFVLFLFSTISCEEDVVEKPILETSTMMDIDSNVYKTVKIGNQWWMAENLKVRKYRNGIDVTSVQADSTWNKTKSSAYCIYSIDHGLLYNWYVISDTSNIAPKGWHIPSDDEWKELEKTIGMNLEEVNKVNWRGTHEGEKLKVNSSSAWIILDKTFEVWSTNESGFTATGGGCRMFDGRWSEKGLLYTGFWWSSTEHTENNEAWYRHLDYKKANVFRFYGPKNYGFSVRCVKD